MVAIREKICGVAAEAVVGIVTHGRILVLCSIILKYQRLYLVATLLFLLPF